MKQGQQGCVAYDAIQILQEKWVLHIIHTLLDGPRGFNELGREVGGCNPTTLNQRLARLESLGLIRKTVYSSGLLRSSYELTVSGRALQCVIDAIQIWASDHLVRETVT
jgi:DNA-binding HxlR family transcriptional regulator